MHLDTDVLPFKPTVVITCFGMVDGGNKALENETADSYRQAQTESVRALKKAGVRTVILGSPRCVDSFTFRNDPAQAAIYNKTLAALADIDREVAASEGAIYADVFGATLAAMQKLKTTTRRKVSLRPRGRRQGRKEQPGDGLRLSQSPRLPGRPSARLRPTLPPAGPKARRVRKSFPSTTTN